MYDLSHFSLSDMNESSQAMRRAGASARTMVDAASGMVRHLYDNLFEGPERSCALVRLYKTHPFGALPSALQEFARARLGGHAESPTMKCLTLLATIGERPEWCTTTGSTGHQAIPLASEDVVKGAPMVSQLIRQFGLPIGDVLHAKPAQISDLERRTYDVFHVADAVGSPYVPAQDEFVLPYKIKSVLGFGGMLPSGDLFAVIMFARQTIGKPVAEMFKTLAVSAKLGLLPFSGRVFPA